MKRFFTFLSAAALVLMAGSCVKEQLTTFDYSEADAPILQSSVTLLPDASNPKSVVLNYTPAVFHRSFNQKMDGYHSLALLSVNGKPVDRTLGAAFDEATGTITLSVSALNKVLMGLGLSEGDHPTIEVAVRASIQPTLYDSSVLSYVQSTGTATITGFTVTAPQGSPYPEYTVVSEWGVTGALSAYAEAGFNDWNSDLQMWSNADGTKHVAKAVSLKEGDELKFRKDQAWTDNYGGSFSALDAEFEAVAGGDNVVVGAEGVYDLWLDTEAKTITVTEAYLPYPDYREASEWSVIGHLDAYGMDWNDDIPMYTDGETFLAMNVTVKDGDEFKFRKDKAWTDNFGGTFGALDAEFEAVPGGDNIIVGAGSYDMFLDADAKTIRIVESLGAGISGIIGAGGGGEEGGDEPEEEILDETWAVIGSVNGTNWDKDFYMTESDGVWTSPVLTFEEGAEFKIRFDNTWFYDDCIVGAAEDGLVLTPGTPVTGIQPGSNFKVAEAGDYRVSFVESTLEVTLISMANQYSLIGNVNGSGWDKDFYLTEADGSWTSDEVTIAGEFKIRFNKSWDDANVFGLADGAETKLGEAMTAAQPGANFKVDEGKYTVVFVPATKSVTIIPSKPTNKWSVIGAVNGSSWNEDFYMSEVMPGIWISDEVLDLTGEWKIRFGSDWAVNRGGAAIAAVGEFGEASQNGANITLVTKAKVVYNANNETLGTLGWGVVGSIASIDGFSWNGDVPMNLAADGKWYSLPVTLGESDEFKIRWMAAWDQDFGGNCTAADEAFDAAAGGSNIKAPAPGTYVLVFDPAAGKLTLSTDFWGLIGGFSDWGSDRFMFALGGGKWAAYNQTISGEWKIRKGAAWNFDYGGTFVASGEPFAGVKGGSNISVSGLDSFDVVLDTTAETITVTGNE